MQWYYAVGSERRGPVDTLTFNGLVNNGTIGPDTLVWRTGMAEWQAWSTLAQNVAGELTSAEGPTAEGSAPLVPTPWPGQSAATDEYLPMEELWARIKGRGYHTSVGSCLSRGWEAMKLNYWGALGTTLLFMLITTAAQQIPILGLAAIFVVSPQLTAGIWLYFIKRSRGESATVGDIFAGYSRGFGQLALLVLLQMLVMIPVIGLMAWVIFFSAQNGGDPTAMMILPLIVVGLVVGLIFVRWQFAHAIIIDRGYSAIEALKLSWRIVGLRFWTLVGLGLMLSLLMVLGLLALIIGVFFLMPLAFSAMVEAYEDAVNPAE